MIVSKNASKRFCSNQRGLWVLNYTHYLCRNNAEMLYKHVQKTSFFGNISNTVKGNTLGAIVICIKVHYIGWSMKHSLLWVCWWYKWCFTTIAIMNEIQLDSATRVDNKSASIIDHVLTNCKNLRYSIILENIFLSDHRAM